MHKLMSWFEPFKYQRVTFDTHWRVRLWWWARWAMNGIIVASVGWLLAVGAAGWTMLGQEYGVRHITSADIVGWYAARICQTTGRCTPEHVLGAVLSVGIVAVGLGILLWLLLPLGGIQPDPVTDDELDEFRQMGYIVMEVEDYLHGFDEHVSDRISNLGAGAGDLQSGELDQAGPADCRADEKAESIGNLAEIY
jgi:hypothetical protein